jgi:hypothetical protein
MKNIPWNKGLKTPDLVKKKQSVSHIGLHHSIETKKRMSIAHAGHVPTRIGPHSIETRKKISNGLKGISRSVETRLKIGRAKIGYLNPMFGKRLSINHRKKISISLQRENAPNWKGGLTKKNQLIRGSLEYRLWREAVFKRDNWQCQLCPNRGGKLHADHIKSFSRYKESRFDINNGRTLCVSCHKKTEAYLNNRKK